MLGFDKGFYLVRGSEGGLWAAACSKSDLVSLRLASFSHGQYPRWHKLTGKSTKLRSWEGGRTAKPYPNASFSVHWVRSVVEMCWLRGGRPRSVSVYLLNKTDKPFNNNRKSPSLIWFSRGSPSRYQQISNFVCSPIRHYSKSRTTETLPAHMSIILHRYYCRNQHVSFAFLCSAQ